jgi:hypothetical protein
LRLLLAALLLGACTAGNDVVARAVAPDGGGDEKKNEDPNPGPFCAELAKGIVLTNKLGDLHFFSPPSQVVKPLGRPKCLEPPRVPAAMAMDRNGTIFIADDSHLVHVVEGLECKAVPIKLVPDTGPVGLAFLGEDLFGFDTEGLLRFEKSTFTRVVIGALAFEPSALVPTPDGRLFGRYHPGHDGLVGVALIGEKDAQVIAKTTVAVGWVADNAPVAAWGAELYVLTDEIQRFKVGGAPEKTGISLKDIHPLVATSSPCATP